MRCTNGHHLEIWPFVWGHTSTNQCLFSACFMFVWPHVNSLPPCLLDVRCRCPLVTLVHLSRLVTLFLNISRYPRPLFPRYAHILPHGFWEMVGLSLCARYQYIIFSRWLSVPVTDGQQREGRTLRQACTPPTSSARFGLGFSPTYLRPQTKKEDDLGGEGLEDRLFSIRFVLVGSFGRWLIHSSSHLFLSIPPLFCTHRCHLRSSSVHFVT